MNNRVAALGAAVLGAGLRRDGRSEPADLFIRAVHALSRICGLASAGLIVAAMLVVCQMVFMRYVLNASTVWQSEAVIYMMIGATLLGLPYVQLLRGHVNVDLLPIYLGRSARFGLAVFCLAMGMAVCVILGGYGVHLVIEAYDGGWQSETVWAVDLWKPYLAVPVGFLMLLLQYLADLVALWTGRSKPFDIET